MARYKGSGPPTGVATRINGNVWSAPGPGATIRGWGYPTQAPSQQFSSYNAAARMLGQRFEDLPPQSVAAWTQWIHDWPDWMFCPPGPPSPIYGGSTLTPEQAFVATNLARTAQGQPWTTNPPPVTARPGPDGLIVLASAAPPDVEPPLAVHVALLWQNPLRDPSLSYVASVWARPRTTIDHDNTDWSRYALCGTLPIDEGSPTQIDLLLLRLPVVAPAARISLRVGIAELGLPPFAWLSGRIKNEAASVSAAVYVPTWAAAAKPTTRPDGSPLQLGDRWWSTVLYSWWTWRTDVDSGRWVSDQTYRFSTRLIADFGPSTSSPFAWGYWPPPIQSDLLIEQIAGQVYVVAPNDAANYWRLEIHLQPGTTYPGTVVGPAADTHALAPNQWNDVGSTTPVYVALGAGGNILNPVAVKYGSPGNAYWQIAVTYRLVMR